MRQAGVIAAAGIVALETMVERLADDHARARRLADALADALPGQRRSRARCSTNIVCARRERAARRPSSHGSRAAGVLAGTIDPDTVRFVTHKDVDDDDLDHAIARASTISASADRDARPLHSDGAPSDDVPARALAVYAHPDDPEISAGGTLARWADGGHRGVRARHHAATRARNDPDADLDALAALRIEETARPRRVLGFAGTLISTIPTASSPTTARCAARSCA